MNEGGEPHDERPLWQVLAQTLGQQGKRVLKAEASRVRQEAQEGAREAMRGGLLLGASAWMALTGLSALTLAAALAVPARPARGALWVGLGLVGGSVAVGLAGLRVLPRRAVGRTLDGLRSDAAAAKQTLAGVLSGVPRAP